MIDVLIDKLDTVEIVRDQIAAILASESANQVALATAAGKPEPNDWALRVYKERAVPWDFSDGDYTPFVNVWYESVSYNGDSGDTIEHQVAESPINIDCYAASPISDEDAVYRAQRGMRYCRNIMMAGEYTYLGLRGLVTKRWPESQTSYQPQQDNTGARHAVATRLTLNVKFSEFSPQVTPEDLCIIAVDICEDGQIVAQAEYDYT